MNVVFAALMSFFLGQAGGALSGTVRDQQGGVLPDVTVTVTGPTLKQPLMTATDSERGTYVITGLPEGKYVVTFSMTCFRTTERQNVRVTAAKAVTVDAILRLKPIAPPCGEI